MAHNAWGAECTLDSLFSLEVMEAQEASWAVLGQELCGWSVVQGLQPRLVLGFSQ